MRVPHATVRSVEIYIYTKWQRHILFIDQIDTYTHIHLFDWIMAWDTNDRGL